MTTRLRELIAANNVRPEFATAEDAERFELLKEELNEAAKDNWGDPAWHKEQAAQLAEVLDYGFKNENPFRDYFPTRAVGKWERVTIRERRGLEVFYTHRAGEIDETQMSSDEWELPKDSMGWHVSENEDDVQANYGDTIASLIPLARQREAAEINRRAFTLVQEAAPVGSDYFEDATSSGSLQGVINTALSEIADVPQASNVVVTRPLTIVGRRAAVDKILDFTGFTDEANEEIRKTGRLGVYRGANIQTLTNWQDEDGTPYVDDDQLFVLGGNIGLFAFYGGPKVNMWTENKVPFTHFQSRRDIGGAVYHPEALRRIAV